MKLKYSILMMLYALICKFAHFMKIYCRFTTVPYVLDQYRTCLELSKTIAKYRAQGANTLKEIINKISRGVFNRLEDKNMIIMLRRLCDNDAEELNNPDFLNEVENNLSKSLQILLPFVSVPNHYNDIDSDRILKDSVEYKNKIYNKFFDGNTWEKNQDSITVDVILEIGQFPDERRKYIHAMLDQSKSLVADFDKMSGRQKRINAEKLATKSLKPDWLLKQQYGESWEKHRYTLNYKDSLLCRSIELDKALPVANFGVSSKNIEIVIEQKLGYYFGNTEERKRLEEAMYPKKSIWLSIARFFGFKSELAKPKAIKSTNGIKDDYDRDRKQFIQPISGDEAAKISFDPKNFSEVPCPIYPSIENVKYLTAEYRAKSEQFKKLNKNLKKQARKILKLTMQLKRNIEPYMHRQDERLLERYNAIKQKIAQESQTEAYLIRLLNLCEQIMHFDKVRLQQLADLNKDNIEKRIAITTQEVPAPGDYPNTTEAINAIRAEYNLILKDLGLVNFSEKFINPVFVTSSNLQRVTSNLDNLQRNINYTCESILDISFKISEIKFNKLVNYQKELEILTLRLKDAENKLIIYLAEARAITEGALNQLNTRSNRNPINIDTARSLLKKYRSLVPNPILLKKLNLVRFFRGWSDAYDQLLYLADTNLGESIKSNKQLIKDQEELLSELTVKKTAQEKNKAILQQLRENAPEYQELLTVIKKEEETIENIEAQIANNSNLLLSSSDKFFDNVEETSCIISSLYVLAKNNNLPKNFEELVLNFAKNCAPTDILENDAGLRDYITKPKIEAELPEENIQSIENIVKALEQQERLIIRKRSSSEITLSNITKIKNIASNLYQEGVKEKIRICYEKYPTLGSEKEYLLEFVPKICMMNENEKEAFIKQAFSIGFIDAKNVDQKLDALQKEIKLIIKNTHVDPIEKVENELEEYSEEIGKILATDATQAMKALNTLEETLKEDLKRLESEIGADIPPKQLKAENPMFEHIEQLENIYPQAYFEDVVLKPDHIEAMEKFRNSLVSQSNSISSADDFLKRVSVKGRPKSKETIEMKLEEKLSIHEEDLIIMREGHELHEKNEDPKEAKLITALISSEEKSNASSVNFDNPLDQARSRIDYKKPEKAPVNFARKALNYLRSIFMPEPEEQREAVILTNAEDIAEAKQLYGMLENDISTLSTNCKQRLGKIFLCIALKLEANQKLLADPNNGEINEELANILQELKYEYEVYNYAISKMNLALDRMKGLYNVLDREDQKELSSPTKVFEAVLESYKKELDSEKGEHDIYVYHHQFLNEATKVFGYYHFNKVIKPTLLASVFSGRKMKKEPHIWNVKKDRLELILEEPENLSLNGVGRKNLIHNKNEHREEVGPQYGDRVHEQL
jgi:hypothetical protein